MRYVKPLVPVLLSFLVLVLIFAVLLPKGPQIIVRHDPESKETIYALEDNSLSLTMYDAAGKEDILRLRSTSKLPLKEQVAILSRMLKKLPKERRFRAFSIGRLIDGFGADRSLSERLKLAASQSPLWDQAKSNPFTGQENKFVREIANQAMIYPELKEMFARYGYDIQLSTVEKVLIDPHTKLPYDCITWFSLSKPL